MHGSQYEQSGTKRTVVLAMRLLLVSTTLLGITFLAPGVTTLEITGYARVFQGKANTRAKLECRTDGPVSHCEFHNHKTGAPIPVPDFVANGSKSCAVSVEVAASDVFVVACRVRDGQSKWIYSETLVVASDKEEFPFDFPVKEIVTSSGSTVAILASCSLPLSKCEFLVPGEPGVISFNSGKDSNTFDKANYEYHGLGLGSGDCGIIIKNVQHSGFVYSFVETTALAQTRATTDFLTLIVSSSLQKPTLIVDVPEKQAVCAASGSPLLEMKWFLGEELLFSDKVNDEEIGSSRWSWSYEAKNLTKVLNLPILSDTEDKLLKCLVREPALGEITSEAVWMIFSENHQDVGKIVFASIGGVLLVLALIAVIYGYFTATLCFSGKCREFCRRRYNRRVPMNEDFDSE